MVMAITPAIARVALAALCLVLACHQASLMAAESVETGFVQKIFRDASGDHKYVVYVPQNYQAQASWPVMLFLHGAGERGTDGVSQSEASLGAMIRQWGAFPWIVVFPQAEDERGPIRSVWAPGSPDGDRALAILEQVEKDYRTDPSHRVLTGWSMGGRGTYQIAAAYPDRWSAVVPIAGWADLELADKLAEVPLWSFHGTDDTLVSFDEDAALIDKIREQGGTPFFTVLPERKHYIWRSVYASPEVFEWMSDPGRFADLTEAPELNPIPEIELSRDEALGPFVPAIEMENAVAIRIGPDMFRDLSDLATEEIAANPLTGSMAGSTTTNPQAGIKFKVQTSNLCYHVPVSNIEVVPTAQGSLRICVSVSNARLTIGRTDLRGLLCRATAGPMHIILGHRQPIPVEIDAVPYAVDDHFRLRARSVRFSIPHGNWYVTKPQVKGFLLPDNVVAESLVEGVFDNKTRIEQEFRQSVAKAVNDLDLTLPEISDDQLLTGLWPVPAYSPRVKPHLDRVEVDEDGLAVVFGMTVASVDPRKPFEKKTIDYELAPEHVGQGDLAIAASQGLLEPLTEQLITAGLAHINVLDVPGDRFAYLADRENLSHAVPALNDLPPTAEIRSELYLRAPLGLAETEEPTQACDLHGCFTLFGMQAPDICFVISVRESKNDRWRDFAEFHFDVTQSIRLELGQELGNGRQVFSQPNEPPEIRTSGRWLTSPPADDTLNLDAATELFRKGWTSWSSEAQPAVMTIPDLTLKGYTRRLDRLEPGPRGMVAVFEEPETVLKNASDEALLYRTKQPRGTWGITLTLPAGEKHVYRVARPLGYESNTGGNYERYDIPPGRDATFKRLQNGRNGLVLDPLPVSPIKQEQFPGTGS